MTYEFEPAKSADTDLQFACKHCGTGVMIGGELGYRSNDAKAQGAARLCTACWNKNQGKEAA